MTAFKLREMLRLAGQARNGDKTVTKTLCERFGIPYLEHLPAVHLPKELTRNLDVAWARKNRLVPLEDTKDRLVVALANPLALGPVDELAYAFHKRVEVVAAPEAEILMALNLLSSESMDSASDLLTEMVAEEGDNLLADLDAVPDLIDANEAAPVIKLVNRILFQAVSEQASDVHIEAGPAAVTVRYRIDGILYDRLHPPRHYLPFLISRVKVMAGLDIAEKRLPQDGRFNFSVAERNIDVRVSVIPTSEGERLVLRLLTKSGSILGLKDLGFDAENLEVFSGLIARPYGIILATGPTGSGKTTTLYAALSRLNSRELNIITIEDPVEYHLPGVAQIQVNPRINLSFARGLRSVLRHDPNVIMIGEIRDTETAEIAIQSALTGHRVFSTLHTNDAPSAVTRLVDMKIEPYLVSSTVVGVIAQRLVRVLCPNCRQEYTPTTEVLEHARLTEAYLVGASIYHAQGCTECFQTGYRGRTGIYELLVMEETVQAALIQSPEANTIRRVAVAGGMETLFEAGLKKVRQGVTTLEEVLRVTAA